MNKATLQVSDKYSILFLFLVPYLFLHKMYSTGEREEKETCDFSHDKQHFALKIIAHMLRNIFKINVRVLFIKIS